MRRLGEEGESFVEFYFDRLGRWTEERIFEVTAERIQRYARATNDTNPAHLRGEVAPPMFAVLPSLMGVHTEAMAAAVKSEVAGYDTRMLHGEQDVFLLAPILPGMRLRSRAAPVGIHVKSSGTLLVTHTETRDEDGRLMNHQYYTNFIRGVNAGRSAGEQAPPRTPAGEADRRRPVVVDRSRVDRDQSYRYADASGDRGPYHVDVSAAKSAGFSGLILHGLCTMAFASRAVVERICAGDGRRLRRLAVRFARPVLLDQELTTTLWAAGGRDGRSAYTFETAEAGGQAVMTLGVAEVAA
jgi:acyl dehydratase